MRSPLALLMALPLAGAAACGGEAGEAPPADAGPAAEAAPEALCDDLTRRAVLPG